MLWFAVCCSLIWYYKLVLWLLLPDYLLIIGGPSAVDHTWGGSPRPGRPVYVWATLAMAVGFGYHALNKWLYLRSATPTRLSASVCRRLQPVHKPCGPRPQRSPTRSPHARNRPRSTRRYVVIGIVLAVVALDETPVDVARPRARRTERRHQQATSPSTAGVEFSLHPSARHGRMSTRSASPRRYRQASSRTHCDPPYPTGIASAPRPTPMPDGHRTAHTATRATCPDARCRTRTHRDRVPHAGVAPARTADCPTSRNGFSCPAERRESSDSGVPQLCLLVRADTRSVHCTRSVQVYCSPSVRRPCPGVLPIRCTGSHVMRRPIGRPAPCPGSPLPIGTPPSRCSALSGARCSRAPLRPRHVEASGRHMPWL